MKKVLLSLLIGCSYIGNIQGRDQDQSLIYRSSWLGKQLKSKDDDSKNQQNSVGAQQQDSGSLDDLIAKVNNQEINAAGRPNAVKNLAFIGGIHTELAALESLLDDLKFEKSSGLQTDDAKWLYHLQFWSDSSVKAPTQEEFDSFKLEADYQQYIAQIDLGNGVTGLMKSSFEVAFQALAKGNKDSEEAKKLVAIFSENGCNFPLRIIAEYMKMRHQSPADLKSVNEHRAKQSNRVSKNKNDKKLELKANDKFTAAHLEKNKLNKLIEALEEGSKITPDMTKGLKEDEIKFVNEVLSPLFEHLKKILAKDVTLDKANTQRAKILDLVLENHLNIDFDSLKILLSEAFVEVAKGDQQITLPKAKKQITKEMESIIKSIKDHAKESAEQKHQDLRGKDSEFNVNKLDQETQKQIVRIIVFYGNDALKSYKAQATQAAIGDSSTFKATIIRLADEKEMLREWLSKVQSAFSQASYSKSKFKSFASQTLGEMIKKIKGNKTLPANMFDYLDWLYIQDKSFKYADLTSASKASQTSDTYQQEFAQLEKQNMLTVLQEEVKYLKEAVEDIRSKLEMISKEAMVKSKAPSQNLVEFARFSNRCFGELRFKYTSASNYFRSSGVTANISGKADPKKDTQHIQKFLKELDSFAENVQPLLDLSPQLSSLETANKEIDTAKRKKLEDAIKEMLKEYPVLKIISDHVGEVKSLDEFKEKAKKSFKDMTDEQCAKVWKFIDWKNKVVAEKAKKDEWSKFEHFLKTNKDEFCKELLKLLEEMKS